MSKFTLTFAPAMSPGACRECGGAKIPMVDMRRMEEFYGSVYFCMECITEIAGLLGFADAAQMERKNETIAKQAARVAELESLNNELEFINDAIQRAGYSKLPTTANTGTIELFSSTSGDTSVSSADEGNSTNVGSVNGSEPGTSESADVENMAGVRASRPVPSPRKSGPAAI